MDSPRSEKVDTRYSTPVSALDDHRGEQQQHQQPQLPSQLQHHQHLSASPIDIPGGGNNLLRPDVSHSANNSYGESAPITRDFEHAVIDDDRSGELLFPAQDGTASPVAIRFSRRHRARDNSREDDDSSSDRSSSPPNSIDAFAEPRRRERANTFGSRAPPDFEAINRTCSGGSHGRRPTLDNHSVRPTIVLDEGSEPNDDGATIEDSARIPRIDYEAMAEFVAESRQGRCEPPRKKYSFSSQGNPACLTEVIKQLTEGGDSEKTLSFPNGPSPKEDRISFFSSEIEKTIHTHELGGLLDPGESFRDLFELSMEVGAWWLDVVNPTHEEMELFQKAFGIHPLTTEDIEQKETREKVELFNTYYFVCFRSYYSDPEHEQYLEPINLYMIVFREGILTFAHTPNPHALAVRRKIGKLKNYDSLTADWICYAMVDNIVDFFFPIIRTVEVEADQIEDQVFVARAEDVSQLLRQIGECRKKVMSLMRLLGGKADVIKGFAKRCNAQYSVTPRGEIGLYLSDIQDHVVTMMSNLGHFEKMLSRSHANYLAQLSVDNLIQGNRANEVLGRITFIATILVPLNLICGLFGMNVPVPGGVNEGSYAMFGGILGVMALIVLVFFVLAKRLRYV